MKFVQNPSISLCVRIESTITISIKLRNETAKKKKKRVALEGDRLQRERHPRMAGGGGVRVVADARADFEEVPRPVQQRFGLRG